MKEETHPPPTTTTATKAAESKCSGVPLSTPPSRLRASSSKVNGSLQIAQKKVVSVSPSTTAARPKSAPKDIISGNSWKIKKSLVSNKPKSGEDVPAALGFQKGSNLEEQVKAVRDRSVNHRPVVEQFSRRILTGPSSVKNRNECDSDGGNTKKKKKKKKEEEYQEKLDDKSEILIHNLQNQVLELKAELENAHSLNFELQSQNRILSRDLAAAEAKIAALTIRDQRELVAEYQSPKFKDIQKLIANKLEHPKIKKEVINETKTAETPLAAAPRRVSTADAHRKVPEFPYALPSPPPPPPPPLAPARAAPSVAGKASAVVKLYGSLSKHGGNNDPPVCMMYNKPVISSAHNSVVREIQSRSSHLLAVKSDIETKGEFINSLIQKVLAAVYTDIEDLLKFVDWLDNELSSLADEQAVIKHFKWPEKKADAMREAAIEYRSLVLLESEVSSYKDDPSIPCGVALKKIACLLDKSERGMQRLIKLRNSVMLSYQEQKIPTDWMLDLGIVSKIKLASIVLAKMYVKRVMAELESVRNSEKESTQETLLLQGVHLAYKAHQFSGVLDSETLCAFEEIRQCVSGHLRGSLEFLAAAIPSS